MIIILKNLLIVMMSNFYLEKDLAEDVATTDKVVDFFFEEFSVVTYPLG